MNIPQADVDQGLKLLLYLRNVLEDWQRVGNWAFENVGDGIAFVLHRQSFMVVALAAADFAQDVNVGQKIHFNAALAFSLARFATSAGNIEGKPTRLVAALARFRQHGVEVANLAEDTGVGRWVRAGSAANRRLVNADDFVDVVSAGNRFVRSRFLARAIECLRQSRVENIVHQGRFSGT